MSIKSKVRSFNRKPLWKRILATVLGLVTIGGAVFGVTKLVEYVNDDLKTIHPSFEVGALGTDGKYVKDEEKLYTKDAFRCDGLQVKLDFDNEISYKIYFYDDVGNFVSSTDTYAEGVDVRVNGTYARVEITPTNEDVGEINWFEKNVLSNQLTIKVYKNQQSKYLTLVGRNLLTVSDVNDLVFRSGLFTMENKWIDNTKGCVTSAHLLAVNNSFSRIELDPFEDVYSHTIGVVQFKLVDGSLRLIGERTLVGNDSADQEYVELDKSTDYVLFTSVIQGETGEGTVEFLDWTEAQMAEVPSRIILK